MIFYPLPKAPIPLYPYLYVFLQPDIPRECISQSLARVLYAIKENIRTREREWDIYKKYTNHYEYIHTVIPHKKKSVSKYKPLSRSYFKMVEIVHELQLIQIEIFGRAEVSYENASVLYENPHTPFAKRPIRTFHLAEGPGGFIEAVVNMRKNPRDVYYGMTILDESNNYGIPAWKKSDYFLDAHPNVVIETGADGTGNILTVANFEYCYTTHSSCMDFITADGGFDFSTDFNKQELSISRLLFAQIAYALIMQKVGGNFVLKIFDCFFANTVDLLFLLTSFYKTIYITKPQTSRTGNSEKYVVCKGFLHNSNESFFPFIRDAFLHMANHPEGIVHRFLQINIPLSFIVKLEEYNAVFGQKQIENIHNTLSLIEKSSKPERIDALIGHNILKCIQWCARYNIPHHSASTPNVFLSSLHTDRHRVPPSV
jgi:23S rRNA U2552 (ribose-2'-O)-methylase RlmE/FtsJ